MQPGDIVDGRFRIERLAGRGGMGAIYKARDLALDQDAAVKVLHAGLDAEPERFARETKLLAQLEHPNIVRYLANGRLASGDAYLALEWIEGEDLLYRITHDGLTLRESLEIIERIAAALAVAHDRGIVHRDIKPSNVMLVGGDPHRVKLLDFGIARITSEHVELTGTGLAIGTPGYMSPEQARSSRRIDARADVYSLGCVLFRCLTGRTPFVGRDPLAVLAKIALEEPPRVREFRADVPAALDDLVARMLSREPARRPADGHAIVQALQSLGPLAAEGGAQQPAARLTMAEKRLIAVVLVPDAARAGHWNREGTEQSASGFEETSDTMQVVPPKPVMAVGEVTMRDGTPDVSTDERHDRALAQRFREIATRFDASVAFLADGSIAALLTGATSATDLALRAARCALAFRASNPDRTIALATGRGEISGPLPVGESIDRAVGLVRGRTPRTGDSSGVWLDDITASLVAHRFTIEHVEASQRLLAEIDDPGEARLVRGRTTPFVGRERELVTLEAIYDECVSEPIARLALVTGGAGEGKSRLRNEFVKKLLAREDSPAVVVARGDPLSAGSAFAMLGQALSRAVGLNAVDSLDTRRSQLRARVAHHVAPPDADRVAHFVGEVVNTPFEDTSAVQLRAARLDPMLMGDQIRRAGEDLLAAETGAYPVLIVLEDLQWGDLATVQFIDGALRRMQSRPFMVLALGRPEVHASFPALFASHAATTIQLAPLTKKSCEKIARAVLGDTQPGTRFDRVVTHAAGNPFYLEELLRHVDDREDTPLPESVLAMMQSRIEALDPNARRILRAASVFGTTFLRDGVASLVAADLADDLDEWLAELTRREWIALRSEATREFAFRQEALREAAYAMLTDTDARIGHRLAGEWLKQTGRADALSLAEHFRRGGANDRAVDCYIDAVRQLLEGNDLAGVLRAADLAISIGATAGARGELRLAEAEAHRWRGENAEAGHCAREALGLLARESTAWFRALGEIVMAAGRTGDVDNLVAHAELILAAKPPTDTRTDEARRIAGARASIQLLHAGQKAHGERVLEIASDGIDAIRDRHPLADAWVETAQLGRALAAGDPVAARVHAEAAVAGCERAGDLRTACMQRVNLGFTSAETGALADAERTLREAVDTARRMGLRDALGIAQSNLGLALTHLGRHDEAIHAMREVVDTLAAQNHLLEGCTRGYLAIAYSRRGDLVDAEREARLAVERLAKAPSARAYALATLSRILVMRGDAEQAVALANDAQVLAGAAEAEEGDAAVRLALAESLRAIGDRDGSRAAIRAARERLTDRAAHIHDSTARAGFLRGPPDHVATFAFDPDA